MKKPNLAHLTASLALCLGISLSTNGVAAVLVTSNNALIAAFQVGAVVNTLEALPGLPTAALVDGTPLPSANQVYKINGGHFHSGGASFNNLSGNPGAPSGVLNLAAGLIGNARSGSHVLVPTHATDSLDPANATVCVDGTCFLEIEFTSPVAKFGGFIGFGGVQVLVKDRVVLADGTDDVVNLEFFSVNAGQFFGVTSTTANIDSITIAVRDSNTFLLDDITTAGLGGGGGGGNKVPEPGTWLLMLGAVAALVLCNRKPRKSKWETMRLAKQTMGALALGAAAVGGAHATVLNFSGLACTGRPGFVVDRTCSNGDPFGRDYGDSAGVNVDYSSANDRGSAATISLPGLYFTDGAGFGNLVDALHGIVPGYLPRIELDALPGYNVTLNGFDLASNEQATSTRFRIYDFKYNLLLDSGLVSIASFGQTRTHFNIGLTSGFTVVGFPQSLILELDNTNGRVALDNLNFSFALAPATVPEPGTVLLFGMGLVGLLASDRRRRNF